MDVKVVSQRWVVSLGAAVPVIRDRVEEQITKRIKSKCGYGVHVLELLQRMQSRLGLLVPEAKNSLKIIMRTVHLKLMSSVKTK